MAVSKGHPAAAIREAVAAGIRHVGENRVQEAREKWQQLQDLPITWHLVGTLQTNKVNHALEFAGLIHSLDRPELAAALDARAQRLGRRINCLVQVNIAGEPSKHGLAPEATLPFLREVSHRPGLQVRGLMGMAPLGAAGMAARPYFRRLRELAEAARAVGGIDMQWLSMGMTADFEAAILEGANLVRVGTAIFGRREMNGTQ